MDNQATTRYWPGRAFSPGTITRISLPLPFGVALKHIERAFFDEGFELFQRVAVSELIKSRIGVEVDPIEMMLLIHPVLAFEAVVTRDDASGLLPLLVTVMASSNDSCTIDFRSSARETVDSEHPLSRLVEEQSHQILTRAIDRLNPAA